MKDTKAIIYEFMEMSSRCAFDSKDNFHYEGYILEIEDECVIFTKESPSDARELLLIPIRKIDLNSLSIWNEEEGHVKVRWDKDESEWKYKISGQGCKWQKLVFIPKGFSH